jgi:hypothetical protein
MTGSQLADEAKMANYLNSLQSKNLYSFANGFSLVHNPDEVITL